MYAATQLQQDGYFLNAIDDSNKTTKLDSGQLFLWSAKALAHSLGRVHEELPAIKDIVTAMVHPQDGLEIKNRRWHLRTYRKCFVGTMIRNGGWMAERVGHEVTYCVPNLRACAASDGIEWMLRQPSLQVQSRAEAQELGEKLRWAGIIEHVCDPQPFKDAFLFFRVTARQSRYEREGASTLCICSVSSAGFSGGLN